MNRPFATLTGLGLTGVGLLHLAWAAGSTIPAREEASLARAVVGQPTMPPRPASAVVGLGLLALASTVLPHSSGGTLATSVRLAGAAGLAGRAVVPQARLMNTLALGDPAAEFIRLDRRFYRPLCAALAAGLVLAAPHSS